MTTSFELGDKHFSVELPENTDILQMKGADKVADPEAAIRDCLENPIGTESFSEIVRKKVDENPGGEAVIVISDNTRPVPLKGEQGILMPLIRILMDGGVKVEQITVLCANGTHIPLADSVFRDMIDPAVFSLGIRVVNHDCLDVDNLEFLGYSKSGTRIEINKKYVAAHIKILTGLVESHFMAGVSGGRKSICPGLIGEDSTFIFHGVPNLDSVYSDDLILENNPCHEEALDVASTVGADFIFNVTLNHNYDVTGFFAGDMVKAHLAAYEKVKDSVGIVNSGPYDIVVTHAGFVGKNHYQAAKTGTAAMPLMNKDSYLILGADCIDRDPIGKDTYRQVLPYLKGKSTEAFINILKSPDWTFVPDQWQVQMWSKLFKIIPQDHFIYYAPQIDEQDYEILSGVNGNEYLPDENKYKTLDSNIPLFLQLSLTTLIAKLKKEGRENIRIAWMSDGPYGIVV
ncbi:lactate racemase domain-containing protein [Oceanispirochaeta sp.]|jgi:nickel-dependent lactate racemase|uniref:lactate racemase domain-containing protein n=1 Tax=Oceanispirochaeta sp. TaxID=2035350 RepID=UPI00260B8CD8|nr:lactate racemase domain-containing protein [Oceanispirochaeta sp.]MDA3958663.1 lactate racemase domain-containing protein [Oceanispirochaeta sp.]